MSTFGSSDPETPNCSQVISPSPKLAWVLIGTSWSIFADPVTVTVTLPDLTIRVLMGGCAPVCPAAGGVTTARRRPAATALERNGMRGMGSAFAWVSRR